ncbi:CLUMA_CG007609, isoform A [Clunio marinus]|uniref:CLUMA_CG007609, isoform A n=1 Tax=Clunio marinus TaxID=568069 RepID=A0A1J1I596_9DIPT|nr:CLUMA_CG007609, isoform A [Clunio marinus]
MPTKKYEFKLFEIINLRNFSFSFENLIELLSFQAFELFSWGYNARTSARFSEKTFTTNTN